MQEERSLDIQILAKLNDMDQRLHKLERWFWMGLGGFAIAQLVLQFLLDKGAFK